jgi:hypothetical protein
MVMLIGLVVQILVVLFRVGACFLAVLLFLGRVKKQACVSKSSTESEYIAMSFACSEITWLQGLLGELGVPQLTQTSLYTDNTSTIQIVVNPVFHKHIKHIKVDYHSIREALVRQEITLPHISTEHQTADIFTKALSRHHHKFMFDKLMLLDRPTSI